MNWFSCKHPAHRLGVDKEETRERQDEDFDVVTYHLICRGCGKRLELRHAVMRGGLDAFMERGREMA
jgi:hypothetical protein